MIELGELRDRLDELEEKQRKEKKRVAFAESAHELRMIYDSYVEAGFSCEEAFLIAKIFLENGLKGGEE